MTLVIAFLLAVCLPPETSLAKKPPNDDPPEPTPPPPVLYEIDFFERPRDYYIGINDMNNAGVVVGWEPGHHGFVYYPNSGVAIDLNDIVAGIPPGWHIRNARAINDSGDIVGHISTNDNPGDMVSACFVDMGAIDGPALKVIPLGEEFGAKTSATGINSSGDIVGAFQRDDGTWGGFLYNPGYVDQYGTVREYGPLEITQGASWSGELHVNERLPGFGFQIAGFYLIDDGLAREHPSRYPFRWDIGISSIGDPIVPEMPETLDLGPDRRLFDHLGVADINNAGIVLGHAVIKVGKGNKTQWAIFRHDGMDPGYILGYAPVSINDQDDFVTRDSIYTNYPGSRIYLDAPLGDPDGDPLGFYYPQELIDPNDPNAADWFANEGYSLSALNNRITDEDGNAIAFGQIAGTISIDGVGRGFVLTPTE